MKDIFCSYCGHKFSESSYPKSCHNCSNITYNNPIPVVILSVVVDNGDGKNGVLLIRRANEPAFGELALPGGFLEANETWQQGAVRELVEETGIVIPESAVYLSSVKLSKSGNIIIFGHTNPISMSDLPNLLQFKKNDEVSGIEIWWSGHALNLGFPTHEEAINELFNGDVFND